MRFGKRRVDLDRFEGCRLRLGENLAWGPGAIACEKRISVGESGVRKGVARIYGKSLLQEVDTLLQGFRSAPVRMVAAFQVQVVSLDARSMSSDQRMIGRDTEPPSKRRDDRFRDLLLHGKNV